jgi:zinc transporter ZupT
VLARVRSKADGGILRGATAGVTLDKSTIWALALLAMMVTPIIALSFAMTSKSRLLKICAYGFTAGLMVCFAAAAAFAPIDNGSPTKARFLMGALLLAAAGWAGRNALAAYRAK